MAKIPTILEAGRADGKLIKTDSIYDDNQEKFLSDKIKEIDDNHNELNDTVNSLNDTVNNNELDIENKLEKEKTRATIAENNLRETINNITNINEHASTAELITVNTLPNSTISNAQQALDDLYKNIIYDVSAYNNGVIFESLKTLLNSSNLSTLIPTSVRHGGMIIRFIQGSVPNSDNKYVQYRLMSTSFSTTKSDWQGIDEQPTIGSDNLVKSGGVANKFAELEKEVNGIIVNDNYSESRRFIAIPFTFTNGKTYRLLYSESNNIVTTMRVAKAATLNSSDEIKSFKTNTTEYSVEYQCNRDDARYLLLIADSSVTQLSAHVEIADADNSLIIGIDGLKNKVQEIDTNVLELKDDVNSVKSELENKADSIDVDLLKSHIYRKGSAIYENDRSSGYRLREEMGAIADGNYDIRKFDISNAKGNIYIINTCEGQVSRFSSSPGSNTPIGNDIIGSINGIVNIPNGATHFLMTVNNGDNKGGCFYVEDITDYVDNKCEQFNTRIVDNTSHITDLTYNKLSDLTYYTTTDGWELTPFGASSNSKQCIIKYRCSRVGERLYINTANIGLIKFVSGTGSVTAPATGTPVETPFNGMLEVPEGTTFLYFGQEIGKDMPIVYYAEYIKDIVLKNKSDIEEIKTGTLPDYYKDYISARILDITKGIATFGENSDAFVFLTDLHVASNYLVSPMLIETLLSSLPCRKCICGGDICNISSSGLDVDDIWTALVKYNKNWYKHINPVGTYYNIRGNHDSYVQKSDKSYVCLSNAETHNALMKRDEMNHVVFDNNNPTGNYYYFDNEQQRIRYIVLDSTDTIYNNKPNFTISENQRLFILKASKNIPNNYGIVYLTHIPFVTTSGVATYSTYTIMLNIIEAVANHVKYNNEFDFSDSDTKVIAVVAGHTHIDEQNYKNGVLHITTACDAAYRDYTKSPLFEDFTPPLKTKGTIYEQTFDVYSISHSKVQSYRIGGGFDRKFNLDKNLVTIGGTLSLSSTLRGAVTWKAYDSYSCDYSNDTWIYNENVASVTDGIVNGKVAGEAVIVAIDSIGNKEFFYVEVN